MYKFVFISMLTLAHLFIIHYFVCTVVQAQDNIMNLPLANCWGEKHILFVKWKYVEAKVYVIILLLVHFAFFLIENML